MAGFAPLLGSTIEAVRLAASELASAFLRYGRAESFEFRFYMGDDRFRVEVVDSILSERNLTDPDDHEGVTRMRILDEATNRWGVLGDGVTVVWFEVLREEVTPAIESDREEMP